MSKKVTTQVRGYLSSWVNVYSLTVTKVSARHNR